MNNDPSLKIGLFIQVWLFFKSQIAAGLRLSYLCAFSLKQNEVGYVG